MRKDEREAGAERRGSDARHLHQFPGAGRFWERKPLTRPQNEMMMQRTALSSHQKADEHDALMPTVSWPLLVGERTDILMFSQCAFLSSCNKREREKERAERSLQSVTDYTTEAGKGGEEKEGS